MVGTRHSRARQPTFAAQLDCRAAGKPRRPAERPSFPLPSLYGGVPTILAAS